MIEDAGDDPALEQPQAFLRALHAALGPAASSSSGGLNGAPPSRRATRPPGRGPGAVRDGDRRRRAGRPRGRLSPGPARPVVRDPGRERAGRRLLAPPMGLAAPVHPGPLRRAAGLPFPGPPGRSPTKDEVADYLETYARAVRAAGSDRRPRGPALQGRATVSCWPPATAGSRPTTWWSPPAPTTAPDPGLRAGAGSGHPAAALQRLPEPVPAAGTATFWSSAPATPEPRSPLEVARTHPPGCRAGHRRGSRSASAACGPAAHPPVLVSSSRGC